jgi:glycosyltransferase involved in cell wall biosynthesis
MKIWAHVLVKNEEKFIWYAIMSVIDQVERVLVWDTGSTDRTLEIIEKIKRKYPRKIIFKEVGEVTPEEFALVRQEMLDKTEADWFLVVDGDEIWGDESLRKVINLIQKNGKKIESIVVPNINLVGDIYHYQEQSAGKYKLAGKEGNFALRAINMTIPGLKSDKPHGTWGWVDDKGRMIQDRDPKKIIFIDAPYIHTTFLHRAGDRAGDLKVPKRKKKYKYELGTPFPLDFYYPEAFFRSRPKIIPSIWEKRNVFYFIKAFIQTPLRKIKRKLIHGKVGY